MFVEVSVALNFIISYLYNKLPRRRVDCFGEELESGVKRKFSGHWYPDTPFKGSAFRCLKVSGVNVDPVVEQAAINSGLSFIEVLEFIPDELTIWVDPGEVSYRIGETGQVNILHSDRRGLDPYSSDLGRGFNPEAQTFRPILDTFSSSLNNLSVSPDLGTPSSWGSPSPTNQPSAPTPRVPVNQKTPTFTAAAFAATKFGSTKLKSHAKRPNRLSPTELGAYVRQNHWMYGVGAVSPASGVNTMPRLTPSGNTCNHLATVNTLSAPRDPLHDLLEYQRLLALQQQQQQQQHNAAPGNRLLNRAYSNTGQPDPADASLMTSLHAPMYPSHLARSWSPLPQPELAPIGSERSCLGGSESTLWGSRRLAPPPSNPGQKDPEAGAGSERSSSPSSANGSDNPPEGLFDSEGWGTYANIHQLLMAN